MQKENDVYRNCASVVLLRPSEVCSPDGCSALYQVLLLHKPRKADAWQLPQGGREEGETIEQAAMRELKEEAGLDARAIGPSDAVYQYDFPKSFRRERPDNVCGQRVEYVFAVLDADQKVVVDDHEVDAYAWALPEEIGRFIVRPEYREFVLKVVEEGVVVLASEGNGQGQNAQLTIDN